MPFPIERKYIIETEKELGVEFPESFKAKMEVENGGEATTEEDNWFLIPFFDKTDNKRISRTANHIVKETIEAKKWDSFPQNGVVIADNGSGDHLILLPDTNEQKKLKEEIYEWLHETGEITQVAKNIVEIVD